MAKSQKAVGFIVKRIYILHGWTYNLDKWQKITEMLKKSGFEPVLLKVPGLTQDSEKSWTISQYVTWLESELSQEVKPITLLGHSNGGRIALHYAIKNPGRIKQLFLLDAAGVYHNDLKIRTKRLVFKNLAKIGKRVKDVPMLRAGVYKLARETDYRDAPEHMRTTMAQMIESDHTLNIHDITVPTVIIWGEHDTVTPLKDARILHKAIEHSKLYVIPSARHSPHDTHPRELVDILKEAVL